MPAITHPETKEEYEVSFVTVTPKLSKEMSDNGLLKDNYRSFKEAGAARYAEDVRQGNWYFTGDTIKVRAYRDTGGNLHRQVVDGQHRLALPNITGVPVTFLFIEGDFLEEAEDIMDTGMVRNLKDVLFANKEGPAGYCSSLASLISASMRYRVDKDRGVVPASGTRPSRSEQLTFLRDNPQLRSGTSVIDSVRRNTDLIPLPVRAAWFILNEVDEEDCEAFFTRLGEPVTRFVPESEGDPIHRLRLAATAAKRRSSGSNDQTYWLRLIIKTWNIWRSGGETGQLSVRGTEKVHPI